MPYQEDTDISHRPDSSGNPVVPEISTSVQEIITADPGYLVRHGTAIICCILLFIAAGAWCIRYPDIIEGAAVITTDPLPIKLKSFSGGRISRLLVPDGSTIPANTPIAATENPTGYDNILQLQQTIEHIRYCLQTNDDEQLSILINVPMELLGEAQPFYNQLLQQLSARLLLHQEQLYQKRTQNLQQQISNLQSLSRIGNQEKRMVEEELRQSDERFSANEKLYQAKVISQQEYYEEAAKLRQKKLQLEQQKRIGIQNSISSGENNRQLLEIQYEHEEKERALTVSIQEALRNMSNYIQTWKQHYLIAAPYTGTIRYLRPLQVNEPVETGEELFAIIPETHRFIATIMIPATGLGKVQVQQQVHLLLDNFPYNEFGFLNGRVMKVSSLPELPQNNTTLQQPMYRVYVQLLDTLVTTYHRTIRFNPEMSAQGRIITRDRNLLQRLIAGLTKMNK